MRPYILVNGEKQYVSINATDVETSNGTTLQSKLDSLDSDIENIPITKYGIPTANNIQWSGSEQAPTFSGYNESIMTLSGQTTGTDVGSYTATVNLNDIVVTAWSDDSTTSKSISWNITKKTVTPPSVTNTSFTYNGNAQAPTVSAYDSNYVTVTNNSQTTPGDYTTTLALVNKTTCEWSDGTTADKTVSWSIAKSDATISATTASVTLDNSTSSSNVAIATNSNGTIVANSTDTGVATVVVNGGVVEITGVAGGTANITVQVATNSNYNASTTLTIPVTNNMSSSGGSGGSGGVVTKVGLLFDGSGFYRVDENLNVISDDNWNPGSVFPFSNIKTIVLEKDLENPLSGDTYRRDTTDPRELQYLTGIDLPKMYTSAQKVPSINSNAVVWWIEKEQTNNNHLCSATPMAHRWICNISTPNSCSYVDLGHEDWKNRRDKLWFNIYDAALIRKLMLIYYSTGTSNPVSVNHKTWLTTYNQPAPWFGFTYPFGRNDWLFGMDRIDYSYDSWENNFDGKIRILLPADASSYGLKKHYNIKTDLDGIDKGVKKTFNIEYLDGKIHMDDLFLELTTESTTGYGNNPPTGVPWTRTTFSGTGCCDGNMKEWGFLGIELANAWSSKGYRMATSYD